MKFDPTKPNITTRDGRKVVIYCTDAPGEHFCIHGRIDGLASPRSWTKEGLFISSDENSNSDLINPPEKIVAYVDVYEDECGRLCFLEAKHCEIITGRYRFVGRNIKIEFPRGEGL